MRIGTQSTATAIGIMNTTGGYLFCFLVFLTILLLVLHAVQQVADMPKKFIVWSALVLAVVITAAGAMWANTFKINKIEIPLDGLRQDVVVMHISDVHLGPHRGEKYLSKIVAETNRHRPDMVLINGDLVDANAALLPGVLSPLADFDAPVYFVGGNHDNYVGTARAFSLISNTAFEFFITK